MSDALRPVNSMALTSLPHATLSAQHALHGHYDVDWFLLKLKSDLTQAMSSAPNFHFGAVNFAVTVAALADWSWMLHARDHHSWQGFRGRMGLDKFARYIASQNDLVHAFTDLANEYKHADRFQASRRLINIHVRWAKCEDVPTLAQCWRDNAVGRQSGERMCIPILTTTNGDYFFRAAAENVMGWWEAFDPLSARPGTPA